MEKHEPLISLEDAAHLLNYSVPGLRKIVNRSRRKLAGEPVAGPTIQFFQPGPKAPIKFKSQWIDDFIQQNTCDPSQAVPPRPTPQRKTIGQKTEVVPPDARRDLGFDAALYEV